MITRPESGSISKNELAAICGGAGISTDWAEAVATGSETSTSEAMITRNNPGNSLDDNLENNLGNILIGAMGPFNIE
jgi:hypothetical protein